MGKLVPYYQIWVKIWIIIQHETNNNKTYCYYDLIVH